MPIPDSARYARDAAEAIGARFEDLDRGEGYLFRISNGEKFLLGGGGNVCAYPTNSATAYTISRDKQHTKAVIAAAGLPVIPGELFFAHSRRIALRSPGREIPDAHRFAANIGYPVFAKPNHGSRGTFAEVVGDAAGLDDYARRVAVEFGKERHQGRVEVADNLVRSIGPKWPSGLHRPARRRDLSPPTQMVPLAAPRSHRPKPLPAVCLRNIVPV
jgi:cyanophycin synthetase